MTMLAGTKFDFPVNISIWFFRYLYLDCSFMSPRMVFGERARNENFILINYVDTIQEIMRKGVCQIGHKYFILP